MKIFTLPLLKTFLIVSIVAITCACNKVRKEYYPNGELKSELTYRNGKLNGNACWYFTNGNKKMECNYSNGQIEGKMKSWHFNGNINREENYILNKREGKSLIYYENGALFKEENYLNDTLDGLYVENYPDGQIKIKGGYLKGMYHGLWEYYDERGLKVGEGNFDKGNGILKGFYWNGKLKREVSYINNEKDGKEIFYSENGEMEKMVEYKAGKIVGGS